MKKIKEILSAFLIIMLIVTILVINRTYALFESMKEFNINMDIAKWNIAVNNLTVGGNQEDKFLIKNLVLDANSNVVAGKVAPGSKGTFDVEIDFRDTDVSVKCEMEIDESRMRNAGLKFNSYQFSDTSITTTSTPTGHMFIVPLTKIKGTGNSDTFKLNVKIAFEWINDETRNIADTMIGVSTARTKLDIPVKMKFSQYVPN
jgi:hypothetical protein